jgi:3-deoxy-D-manno-octulosonic-acid transferase
VIEEFRKRHPDYRILLTFFSPSGYEVRKNYEQADIVRYLPMDTPRNVRRFLDTYQPTLVFFVKYEFWFNYLDELKKRNISTYIFSAIFRENQYFFKWYGKWFLNKLRRCFSNIFVQNGASMQLLGLYNFVDVDSTGDTRFDRVHQIAEAAERNEVVEAFLNGHDGKILVAGSTWPPDEALIHKLTVNNEQLKVILAPHMINEEHLRQIEKLFPDSIRYSQFSIPNSQSPRVLIIDNIGLLSKIYRYATVAYIGGGFGVGIHNILEAITFGKPVIFGPNYRKFQEAHDIIAHGGGWSVKTSNQLDETIGRLLKNEEAYAKATQACTDYMNRNLGSTQKILRHVDEYLEEE